MMCVKDVCLDQLSFVTRC